MSSVGKTHLTKQTPILNFNAPKKAGEVGTTGGTKKITTVDMKFDNSIGRTNLDTPNGLYASLGVNISKQAPAGSVERYAQVAPEFAAWNGNLAISKEGKKEAVDYLNAYNTAVKDYAKVAPHMQSGIDEIAYYMLG